MNEHGVPTLFRGLAIALAWYEGFFAGQKGLSKFTNPYAGTEYEETWLHGWEVGNADA